MTIFEQIAEKQRRIPQKSKYGVLWNVPPINTALIPIRCEDGWWRFGKPEDHVPLPDKVPGVRRSKLGVDPDIQECLGV